jgi:hypothetical protein
MQYQRWNLKNIFASPKSVMVAKNFEVDIALVLTCGSDDLMM